MDIVTEAHENKEADTEKPFHKCRDSFLSTSRNLKDYKGFLNLLPIILILSGSHAVLDYILKYGLLINLDIVTENFGALYATTPILAISGLQFFILFSVRLEVLLSKGAVNENFGLILIISSLTLTILTAPVLVYFINDIFVSFLITLFYLTVFLKLISYHIENYYYRKRRFKVEVQGGKTSFKQKSFSNRDLDMVQYPDNLSIKNLYYFLFAPTLCYELNFPRISRIRPIFLIKSLLELLFLSSVMSLLSLQAFPPLFHDYQEYYKDKNCVFYAVINAKCLIIHLCILLIWHYQFYHAWLNVFGEVLRFGDRQFYGDWWNSSNMRQFWRTWSEPVKRYALRYLYKPMINRGYTELQATAVVFFFSGFFHEYIFSTVMKTPYFRVFPLLLVQIPLVHFSSRTSATQTGNMAFWFFMIFSMVLLTGYFAENTTNISLGNSPS